MAEGKVSSGEKAGKGKATAVSAPPKNIVVMSSISLKFSSKKG